MKKGNENRRTYTLAEAGELLGLSKNAVYNAAHRGELPTIKLGGRFLVPKIVLDRMLESGQGQQK